MRWLGGSPLAIGIEFRIRRHSSSGDLNLEKSLLQRHVRGKDDRRISLLKEIYKTLRCHVGRQLPCLVGQQDLHHLWRWWSTRLARHHGLPPNESRISC